MKRFVDWWDETIAGQIASCLVTVAIFTAIFVSVIA